MTDRITLAPSGLYYPNVIARQMMTAAEEVLGRSSLNIVLYRAGLDRFTEHFPPANLRREFDFADFSAMMAAINDTGERTGEPEVGFRIGQHTFKLGLDQFGAFAGMGSVLLGMRSQEINQRALLGLQAMASIFSAFSDQKSDVVDHADHMEYRIHNCPICWGQHADHAICGAGGGLLFEGLRWATDRDWHVEQTCCRAMGDACCTFEIRKQAE